MFQPRAHKDMVHSLTGHNMKHPLVRVSTARDWRADGWEVSKYRTGQGGVGRVGVGMRSSSECRALPVGPKLGPALPMNPFHIYKTWTGEAGESIAR